MPLREIESARQPPCPSVYLSKAGLRVTWRREDVYLLYEGRLQSSWTHLITPSRNFVEVSFSMHFLQRSTHFSKMCCRPLITSKFLASELPFHGWKSPEIAWGEIWIEFCVRLGKSGSVEPHQNIRHTVQISSHAITGLFQSWKGSSEARYFEVVNGLQHVFEKWVERCKRRIACQGRYFKRETVTAPPQSSDSE
jgi:hypothetical protein